MSEKAIKRKELTKEDRIRKEKNRLTKIYKFLPEKEFKTAEKLIDNIAFMSATLEDLMEIINNDELIKTTINASQIFIKEHPALTSYNKMYANFLKGIQQLNSLLQKEIPNSSGDSGDEYLEFMKRKK